MDELKRKVTVVAARTLSAILVAMLVTLLYALFDGRVNNEQIFSIIDPAFYMIVGAFVGVITSVFLGKKNEL